MNPSASGWIKKYLRYLDKEQAHFSFSETTFYQQLRASGFIYANSIKTVSPLQKTNLKYTTEELTKINMFDSLLYIFTSQHPELPLEKAVEEIVLFYTQIEKKSASPFTFLKLKISPEEKLEKILQERIQINNSIIKKNFSHLITNALLFIDVLAFQEFLRKKEDIHIYLQEFENMVAGVVYQSFTAKKEKTKYDNLILQVLKSSFRFHKLDLDKEYHYDAQLTNDLLEKYYLIDLACVTVYSDEKIEKEEVDFIKKLGNQLGLENSIIDTSLVEMRAFFTEFKNQITYFQHSNALNNLYKNSNRMVKLLVLRNKNRLIRELLESKELVVLLSKSTHKNLTDEERMKVKNQLLDICKSIPSLAIFIMPGGSVLLPILIKFIPQLLPSTFNENRLED
ncbi:LETM1-related biofilm-associated protein [Mesonia sp. MT50]|uniref:LETM1-related biofilm-associated protein n=1 Tax=Mesonia profundi TaxID=3070998 RepID=A0ABU1A234_9FLAO|nr:LETM1-related biofilm-associated protein [Mesonia profundi]MDQ7917765.1 LETM1-related biofilm-associated protein [Mesonia profundi]